MPAFMGKWNIDVNRRTREEIRMKRMILAVMGAVGLAVLVAAAGNAVAGENNFDPWRISGPVETGSLSPPKKVVPPAEKSVSPATREGKNAPSEFDLHPEKWQESGGE